jgi:Flp pilus assembly protein TadD
MAGSVILAGLVGGCTPVAPDRAREYTRDGVALFQKGSYAEARESFEAAVALKPSDPNLLFNLGQCYERLGRTDRAEQLYQQCLAATPQHPECRHALTALLVSTNRRPAAERVIQDWLRAQPELSTPHAEDGWLKAQDGDIVAAQTRFQQALALNPRDNLALVEMARLYEKLQRPDRALELYERALEFQPNQPEVRQRVQQLREQGATAPRPD